MNIILAIPKKLNHNGYIYSISALLYSIHTSYIAKPFKKKLYLEALDILVSLDLLDYLDHLELLENLESQAFYPGLDKTKTA